MVKQSLTKGTKVRALWFTGRDVTIGGIYEVVAGPGDADVSISSGCVASGPLTEGDFNIVDDVGDIRHTRLNSAFDEWEVLPNE
jgi:hypothetical protein